MKLTTVMTGGEAARFGWAARSNRGGERSSSRQRLGRGGAKTEAGTIAWMGGRGHALLI
jgi:hypothetical protein